MGQAAISGKGGDAGDLPLAAFEHVGEKGFDGVDGTDDVDPHDVDGFLDFDFVNAHVPSDAGVGDDQVNGAKPVVDGGFGGDEVVEVGDVTGDGEGLSTDFSDLRGQGIELVSGSGKEGEVVPPIGEDTRQRFADAGGRAGDECDGHEWWTFRSGYFGLCRFVGHKYTRWVRNQATIPEYQS